MPRSPRARALGAELRRLRRVAGISQRELAARVGIAHSQISRIETGDRTPSEPDVSGMLGALGITGPEREQLLAMTRTSDDAARWESDPSYGLPRQLSTLIDYERRATRITDVATLFIPGLLQTAAYARAVMEVCHVPERDISTRVATRLGRQGLLNNPSIHYEALIDEILIRRRVGSFETMSEQLSHLLQLTERPNVTLRIIPLAAGAHIGLDAGHLLLEFETIGPIVHLEARNTAGFLREEHSVEDFRHVAKVLRSIALEPAESKERINRCREEVDAKSWEL
ncbi:helix-turn-helix domain-containing protein [Actinoalloteichus caeruleus]|uniref:helix-turn-helix domain-containing protein n=1 Tax=Actinoalloteichus cyanogriseus TaxID=2893586 RepID=UPI0004C02971